MTVSKKVIQVTIILDGEEARWLRRFIETPRDRVETAADYGPRLNLWNALEKALNDERDN